MTSFLPDLTRHESEKYYTDPKQGGTRQLFPCIRDRPTLDLSVIVPAYNEQDRCKSVCCVKVLCYLCNWFCKNKFWFLKFDCGCNVTCRNEHGKQHWAV